MIYLYCLLPAEVSVSLDGIIAMEEDHPPSLVGVNKLQAVISEVGKEFDEANLNARIRDLDWISPRAVRHHEVVDALYTRCHWLLPLSFGAIFGSIDTLRSRLAQEQGALRSRLESLRQREEWDVKVSRDEAQFMRELAGESPALQAALREVAHKPPGTRFLLEKKLGNLQAQESKRVSSQVRNHVHMALSAVAAESQRDELSAAAGSQQVRLELRSAYLVEEGQSEMLKQALDTLAETYSSLGYSFEITGPWPAFSFASGLSEALA